MKRVELTVIESWCLRSVRFGVSHGVADVTPCDLYLGPTEVLEDSSLSIVTAEEASCLPNVGDELLEMFCLKCVHKNFAAEPKLREKNTRKTLLFKSAYLSFPVELQWALRSCVLFHLT
jgi:hypothetical protein